jgi:hypothetical protein
MTAKPTKASPDAPPAEDEPVAGAVVRMGGARDGWAVPSSPAPARGGEPEGMTSGSAVGTSGACATGFAGEAAFRFLAGPPAPAPSSDGAASPGTAPPLPKPSSGWGAGAAPFDHCERRGARSSSTVPTSTVVVVAIVASTWAGGRNGGARHGAHAPEHRADNRLRRVAGRRRQAVGRSGVGRHCLRHDRPGDSRRSTDGRWGGSRRLRRRSRFGGRLGLLP